MLVARSAVTVESEEDGAPASYALRPGETLTLVALEHVQFTVADAGLVEVSLNGADVTEGTDGSPHTYRFTLGDDGGESSPNG